MSNGKSTMDSFLFAFITSYSESTVAHLDWLYYYWLSLVWIAFNDLTNLLNYLACHKGKTQLNSAEDYWLVGVLFQIFCYFMLNMPWHVIKLFLSWTSYYSSIEM